MRGIMLRKIDVSVCTKLFSREIIGEIRFREDKLNEDFLFLLDIIPQITKIRFVGGVGYYYYVRSGSTSRTFGKAFVDMVDNSLIARDVVSKCLPTLKKEAFQFSVYQHMAFLLAIPTELATKQNFTYIKTLKYIRKNILKIIANKYLTIKNKAVILFVAVAPRAAGKLYKREKRGRAFK